VKPGSNVLLYDDAGDHTGLMAAEVLAEAGAKVEIMTRDRSFAPDVMGMNLVPYMRALQKHDVTFTVTFVLESVVRDGNQLRAVIGSDYGGVRKERLFDQVVINHGTRPLDELYFALKPLSRNLGEVDYPALMAGKVQAVCNQSSRHLCPVPHW
jgi:NADPH-dependent 2,4-dienoyl-CoA reductase/sulfur reductase-like enzyme